MHAVRAAKTEMQTNLYLKLSNSDNAIAQKLNWNKKYSQAKQCNW